MTSYYNHTALQPHHGALNTSRAKSCIGSYKAAMGSEFAVESYSVFNTDMADDGAPFHTTIFNIMAVSYSSPLASQKLLWTW
jgi:hypothetical protein